MTQADHDAAAGLRRLETLRAEGRRAFEAQGLPTRRLEAWKHAELRPLRDLGDGAAPAPSAAALARVREILVGVVGVMGGLPPSAARLVLVNGRPAPALGDLGGLPAGLRVLPLAQAAAELPGEVAGRLGTLAHPELGGLVALSQAHLSGDAVVIHAARGALLEASLEVVHVAVPTGGPDAAHPRLLVVAGEASQLTLVERWLGVDGGPAVTNAVTELALGDAAVVRHVTLVAPPDDAVHVGAVVARLGRAARYGSHVVSLSGALGRTEVHAHLEGEGAEAALDGLYLASDGGHLDHYTVLEHRAPRTTSHELYKGVVADEASASFIGRVLIHEGATGSATDQLNHNLLLSRSAQAHTRPQLEIDNDDVRASHGATVGQLDELAVFYLQSRGLDEASARGLLTWAFAEEMVQRLPVEGLRRELGHVLAERLASSASPAALAAIEEAL